MRIHFSRCLPVFAMVAIAWCQQLTAQVVQLPVIRNFSVSGGAIVPDGGTTSLGGVGYAAGQTTTTGWGPFSTRAGSSMRGSTSANVSASIIDLAALDEAILAQAGLRPVSSGVAAGNSAPGPLAPQGAAVAGSRAAATSVTSRAVASAAAYRDRSASPQQRGTVERGWTQTLAGPGPSPETQLAVLQADENLSYYLYRAREADQAGRRLAADVYHRLALEKMSPTLREEYFRTVERRQLEALEKEKENIRRAGSMKF
jgi:hypothetical protein